MASDPFLSRPPPPRFKQSNVNQRARSGSSNHLESVTNLPTSPRLNSTFRQSTEPIRNGTDSLDLDNDVKPILSDSKQSATPDALLRRLETLLLAKSHEIQLAGKLGESLLSQQAELEDRIRHVESEDFSDYDTRGKQVGQALSNNDVRKKLEDLEAEMRRWESANEEMYRAAGLNTLAKQVDRTGIESSADEGDKTLADGTLPETPVSSRRARNNIAQHRANDIEFAAEIGQSLLVEVRRLQTLLQERDDALKEAAEYRDGLERDLATTQAAQRAAEEANEKFKEENWNLELTVQEGKNQLADANSLAARTETERAKLAKALGEARETHDAIRAETDRLSRQQAAHEAEVATMRKTQLSLQRDKNDLQGALDRTKQELALKAVPKTVKTDPVHANALDVPIPGKMRGTSLTKIWRTSMVLKQLNIKITGDGLLLLDSPQGSTISDPHDTQSLRAALAHSQKTINSLKSALQRERVKISSPASSSLREDKDGISSPLARHSHRRSKPAHGKNQGSGKRLVSKLGQDDDNSVLLESDDSFSDEQEEDGNRLTNESLEILGDPFGRNAAKGSIGTLDGMDPAFANLDISSASLLEGQLRRTPSETSLRHDNRPSSGMFASIPQFLQPKVKIISVDEGTMTEEVFHLRVEMIEAGVQTGVFLPKGFVPIEKRLDTGVQTRPSPVRDIGVNTEKREHVDQSLQTDYAWPNDSLSSITRDVSKTTIWSKPYVDPIDGGSEFGDYAATETDNDSFVDARETIGVSTPAAIRTSVHLRDLSRDSHQLGDLFQQTPTALPDGLRTPTGSQKALVVDAAVQTIPISSQFASSSIDHQAPSRRDSVSTFGGAFDPEGNSKPADQQTSRITPGPTYIQTISPSNDEKDEPMLNWHARPESAASSILSGNSDLHDSAPITRGQTVDRSRPPTIAMPPPPTMPPPPNLMTRKILTGPPAVYPENDDMRGLLSRPSRPNSPPPVELLQRAQSPIKSPDGLLSVSIGRPSHSSVPATTVGTTSKSTRGAQSSVNLRQHGNQMRAQPSFQVSEFGSVTTGGVSQLSSLSATSAAAAAAKRRQVASSAASFSSFHAVSRRLSMDSDRTSDAGARQETGSPLPFTSEAQSTTDPAVIHAITQTMIGEFLFKYTRKMVTKGISEKRHMRFFWVHPYTKTLYWSSSDPGSPQIMQSSAKSVFIEEIRQVFDPNPYPPGMHQHSLIIRTPQREMKITAPTKERHDMWFNAITYLLARPDQAGVPDSPLDRSSSPFGNLRRFGSLRSPSLKSPSSSNGRFPHQIQRLQSAPSWSSPPGANYATGTHRSIYNHTTLSEPRITPGSGSSMARHRMSTSTLNQKRSNTPAAEFLQHTADFGSPRSTHSFFGNDSMLGDESLEIVDPADVIAAEVAAAEHEDGYEGLENVRVCCGEHDVGRLSKEKHHHHHDNGMKSSTSSRKSIRSLKPMYSVPPPLPLHPGTRPE